MQEFNRETAAEHKLKKNYCFLPKQSLFLPRLHTLKISRRLRKPTKEISDPISTQSFPPFGSPIVQFLSEDSNSIDIQVSFRVYSKSIILLLRHLSPVLSRFSGYPAKTILRLCQFGLSTVTSYPKFIFLRCALQKGRPGNAINTNSKV